MNTAPFVPPTIIEPTIETSIPFNSDINATQQETERRLEFCIPCEDKILVVDAPACKHCNCSISLLSTVSYKSCPIGKW